MAAVSKNSNYGLRELLTKHIKNLFDAEYRIEIALSKMAKKTTSLKLREILEKHCLETQGHEKTLLEVFDLLGEFPERIESDICIALVNDGNIIIEAQGDSSVIDAGIIVAARRIEHYEIASYEAVAEIASQIGEDKISKLLTRIIVEEGAADQKFSHFAHLKIEQQQAHPIIS